jgi:N6-L-threonylcarbamoyladenine synthase
VIDKLKLAIKLHGTKTILLGGGVTNSRTLREKLKNNLPDQNFLFPDFALTLDNAAMIAGLGYHIYTRQGGDSLNLTAETSISLES